MDCGKVEELMDSVSANQKKKEVAQFPPPQRVCSCSQQQQKRSRELIQKENETFVCVGVCKRQNMCTDGCLIVREKKKNKKTMDEAVLLREGETK
jgi:hypothetical protein